jgi:hypothetical protein
MHARKATGAECNYLGLEIRQPLVERANQWAQRLGCSKEVAFMWVAVLHVLL